jgi:hypothetical protein
MDIAIRSVGEVSGLTENPFTPGDTVWSYLYRTTDGYIERLDILSTEKDQLELEGTVICRWSQLIKEKGVTEAEERRAALQSADEGHMPTKRELPVPDMEITPELIAGFQNEISLMGSPR